MKRNKATTARQSWDVWIWKQHGELRTWKTVAILELAALIVILSFSLYYYTQPKYLPYVVSVNDQGDIDFKGVMHQTKISISDAMIRNYLIRFITDIATLSNDYIAQKNKLVDAYYIATPSGQRQLTEFIKETNALSRSSSGEERVDIKFASFEKIAESTWRVEWSEYFRNRGALVDRKEMAGNFSYERADATTPQEAEKNPLGIYFSDFFITDIREH